MSHRFDSSCIVRAVLSAGFPGDRIAGRRPGKAPEIMGGFPKPESRAEESAPEEGPVVAPSLAAWPQQPAERLSADSDPDLARRPRHLGRLIEESLLCRPKLLLDLAPRNSTGSGTLHVALHPLHFVEKGAHVGSKLVVPPLLCLAVGPPRNLAGRKAGQRPVSQMGQERKADEEGDHRVRRGE